MGKLCELPNIGKILEGRLAAVEINDTGTLFKAGSKDAFTRLRLLEGDTCFSTLCALEGAVQGIRWHFLSKESREELKKFFDSFS